MNFLSKLFHVKDGREGVGVGVLGTREPTFAIPRPIIYGDVY